MKKRSAFLLTTIAILLIVVLALGVLTSCSKKNANGGVPASDEAPSTVVTPDPTPDSGSTENNSNPPQVNMTETYASVRFRFLIVTYISLPQMEKLEAAEAEDHDGDTSYSFDLVSGENLNYQTYEAFEAFFKKELGECDQGYPVGTEAEGRTAQWTKNGRLFEVIWDKNNSRIHINTRLTTTSETGPSADPDYVAACELFEELFNVTLPALNNVTLADACDLDPSDNALLIVFTASTNVFQSIYDSLKYDMDKHSDFVEENEFREENDDHATWRFVVNSDDGSHLITVALVYEESDQTVRIIGSAIAA